MSTAIWNVHAFHVVKMLPSGEYSNAEDSVHGILKDIVGGFNPYGREPCASKTVICVDQARPQVAKDFLDVFITIPCARSIILGIHPILLQKTSTYSGEKRKIEWNICQRARTFFKKVKDMLRRISIDEPRLVFEARIAALQKRLPANGDYFWEAFWITDCIP
jgi:hypothetical protein